MEPKREIPPEINGYSTKEMIGIVLIPMVKELKGEFKTHCEANDMRFRNLEGWRNKLIGAYLALIFALSTVGIYLDMTNRL